VRAGAGASTIISGASCVEAGIANGTVRRTTRRGRFAAARLTLTGGAAGAKTVDSVVDRVPGAGEAVRGGAAAAEGPATSGRPAGVVDITALARAGSPVLATTLAGGSVGTYTVTGVAGPRTMPITPVAAMRMIDASASSGRNV
jgi:hypothetical protein